MTMKPIFWVSTSGLANFYMNACNFSKELSKIVQVALKYQLRMPPYFTLVLRSLACLEGTCNPILGFFLNDGFDLSWVE